MSRGSVRVQPLQTMCLRRSLPSAVARLAFALLPIACFSTCFAACFADRAAPSAPGDPGNTDASVRGCTVATSAGGKPPPMAPNGYYVNGATVCTPEGQPHLFHGVDRPSFEFESSGENISSADFLAIAGWNANVVRIALNQDFWLSGAALYDPDYESNIMKAVQWAEAAGLDVILDLHWSDRGALDASASGGQTKQDTTGGSNQQQMADSNSVTFWTQVATDFKGDGRVLFELYNEPNGIPWGVWLNGGEATGFLVAGMQQLYNAVRAAGADNVVIAGGLSWAFDLSQVYNNLITGYNIMYATHPYKGGSQPSAWENSFGYLATQNIAPVIATEFGDPTTACTGDWDTQVIGFADSHQISWTAWAWYPGGCAFPSLISDWPTYTPTVQGTAVRDALAAYPANPKPDAGADVDAALDGDATVVDGRDGSARDATGDATIDGAGEADATLGSDDAGAGDANTSDADAEGTTE
jgi:endoglucanase